MSENGDTQTAVQATQGRIVALLDDLSPESLTLVERFVQFLRDQARRGQPVVSASVREERPPHIYPTVPLPASALDGLVGVMPPVEGDAFRAYGCAASLPSVDHHLKRRSSKRSFRMTILYASSGVMSSLGYGTRVTET
jgi:hypothetical protein